MAGTAVGGATAGMAATVPPEQEREIAAAFGELQHSLNIATDSIENVHARLTPVLSTPRPKDANDNKTAQPDAPLAQVITESASQVDRFVSVCQDILERLEL